MLVQCVTIPAYCREIQVNQLPKQVTAFVTKNFPGKKVIYAGRQFKGYKVILNNGTKIVFDTQGAWDKVNCKAEAVPNNLVPSAISKYVKSHFAGSKITEIKMVRNGYNVELSNKLEMQFDRTGAFCGFGD